MKLPLQSTMKLILVVSSLLAGSCGVNNEPSDSRSGDADLGEKEKQPDRSDTQASSNDVVAEDKQSTSNTSEGKAKAAEAAAMTDAERISELLLYFKKNGFPLEERTKHSRKIYVIEKSADGSIIYTSFLLFPFDSDDKDVLNELRMISLLSIYNRHCKIAMFLPGGRGTIHSIDPVIRKNIGQYRGKDSKFLSVFKAFKPGK